MRSIDAVHHDTLRHDLPAFRAGDTVRVHVRIKEGEKERIQVFEGVVIQPSWRSAFQRRPSPFARSRTAWGSRGSCPFKSPNVTKIEIKSRGHVRRAKLYYLRDLSGKKARLHSKVRDIAALNVLSAPEGESGTAAEALADEPVAAEAAAEAAAPEATEADGDKSED